MGLARLDWGTCPSLLHQHIFGGLKLMFVGVMLMFVGVINFSQVQKIRFIVVKIFWSS